MERPTFSQIAFKQTFDQFMHFLEIEPMTLVLIALLCCNETYKDTEEKPFWEPIQAWKQAPEDNVSMPASNLKLYTSDIYSLASREMAKVSDKHWAPGWRLSIETRALWYVAQYVISC